MVEAAGVEPASGNLQQGASTCIAVDLNLAFRDSRGRIPGSPAYVFSPSAYKLQRAAIL